MTVFINNFGKGRAETQAIALRLGVSTSQELERCNILTKSMTRLKALKQKDLKKQMQFRIDSFTALREMFAMGGNI